MVLLVSTFLPDHNWDEFPYLYLSTHTTCAQREQASFYRNLEVMLPREVVEGAIRGGDYETLVATNHDYFCSNLRFYTVKRLYIHLIRWVQSISGEPLLAVRSLSILPAALGCGLLSFQILGATGLMRVGRALLLLQTVWIFCLLGKLSTPDAAGTLFLALGTALVTQSFSRRSARTGQLQAVVPTPLEAAALVSAFSLAVAIRTTLGLTILALALALFTSPGAGPQRRLGLLVAAAVAAGLVVDRSLQDSFTGLSDHYDHLTLWVFSFSGQLMPPVHLGGPITDGLARQRLAAWMNSGSFLKTTWEIYGESLPAVLLQISTMAFTSLAALGRCSRQGTGWLFRASLTDLLGRTLAFSVLAYLAFWLVFPEPDHRFFAAVSVVIILLICLADQQERSGSRSFGVG